MQRQRRFSEAADIYRSVLAQDPRNYDATHLLGLTALEMGDYAEAQRLIRAAVGWNPQDAAAIGNLGICFLREGRPATAFRWLEVALALQPESASARFNAATALYDLGRYCDAVALLQPVHAADPTSYPVCLLLGESLLASGNSQEAAHAFDAATYALPESGHAWLRLSVACAASGEHAKARECAARAAALGTHTMPSSEREELRAPRDGAVDLTVPLLSDIAFVALVNGLHDEALEALAAAHAIEPANLNVRWTQAIAGLKPVYRDTAELVNSRAVFGRALEDIAASYERTSANPDVFKVVGVIQPFYISYQPYNNRELLMRHGALCTTWMTTLPIDSIASNAPQPAVSSDLPVGRKLRVGIASTQIRDHSTWNAITKGWVTQLDRDRFELVIFQLNADVDRETEVARRAATHVEDRPTTITEWIAEIRRAALDVLLYPSIGMDPLTLQLGSLRLAPVQGAAWGHPETTGLPTIDLYLSAEDFEPPDAREHYCEQLVRLPHCGVYVEPMRPDIAELDLRSLGLPDDVPLMLCPGTTYKYSPLDDDVWVEIARQLRPRLFRRRVGALLIFFRGRVPASDRLLETRLRAAFARGNVEFDAHVRYLNHLERPRFFGLLRRSALMLDTLGFSGFNLAVQAMECDLPLLAYEGEFMRGRLASGVLRRLGLSELVAASKPEFIRKAVELALDVDRRAELRAAIRERRGLLFHDAAPVRALERELNDAFARSRRNRDVIGR